MATKEIEYIFTLPNGAREVFLLQLDAVTLELAASRPIYLPAWTALENHRCANCPLNPATHERCPLAACLVPVVHRLGDLLSWDTAIANDRYTVIVKRLSTSELVAKYHILDSACAVTCSFDPEILTDLVPGAQYRWFVKARGLNGDTAKSAKQNFVVPFGISD